MDIQKTISVSMEVYEQSVTDGKKLGDKDILFSASLMGHPVSMWNLRTCDSNFAYQF